MILRADPIARMALSMMAAFCAAAEPISPKTLMLTFDDAVKPHLTVVAPAAVLRGRRYQGRNETVSFNPRFLARKVDLGNRIKR
jgi:hypothetical protein